MAQKVIFEEQTLTLPVSGGIGQLEIAPAPFTLAVGETYLVILDGVEYELVCGDMDGVPNIMYAVLDENGDGTTGTFIIMYGSPEVSGAEGGMVFFQYVGDAESHTLAVYQDAAETPAIILKDRDGNDLQYDGGLPVRLLLEDGTEQTYIPGEAQEKTIAADFSKGNMVVTPDAGKLLTEVTIPKPETLTPENIVKDVEVAGITGTAEMPESVETSVALDFSGGDMEVTPEEGKVFSKVAIPTPANLIPANIAEGVDIAGIVGTLAGGGGGGSAVFARGSFTGTGGVETVNHNLGVIPDVVAVFASKIVSDTTKFIGSIGYSSAMIAKGYRGYVGCDVMEASGVSAGIDTDASDSASLGYIRNATESTFQVGGTAIKTDTKTYRWIAIGGLT